MVHIVEIEESPPPNQTPFSPSSSSHRHGAGKEMTSSATAANGNGKKRLVTYILEIAIFIQFTFGFIIALFGLSGLPADLDTAAKVFGLGLGQTLCAAPGLLSIKLNSNRSWIGFASVQGIVALAQLAWFIVLLNHKPVEGWLGALYFCLFAFQLSLAVGAIFHARITSFPILISELRGKREEALPSSFKSVSTSRRSASNGPARSTTSSTVAVKKETKKKSADAVKEQTNDSSKLSSSKKISTTPTKKKEASKSEQVTERAPEQQKPGPATSAKKPDQKSEDVKSNAKVESTSKNEPSLEERMKNVPEATTPPVRRPRYYFIEHAIDIESVISDESPTQSGKTSAEAVPSKKKKSPSPSKVSKATPATKEGDAANPTTTSSSKSSSKATAAAAKLPTPPLDSTQPNSNLSSQATQPTSTTTNSSAQKKNTPAAAAEDGAPKKPTMKKGIPEALEKMVNHQLLHKTL